MAPTPKALGPIQLFLTFPTLASLSASHASQYLPQVKQYASASSHITIIVKTFFDFPYSTSSGVGGSSSSSTAKGKGKRGPSSEWERMQGLLGRLYGTASSVFVKEDRWEDVVDVVLVGMREIPVCADEKARTYRMEVESVGDGDDDDAEEEGNEEGRDYETTAMGGTFDHLHAGHKILLTMAAFITRGGGRLIVGVTDTNLLTKKKHGEYLESLDTRIQKVKDFLSLIKPSIEADVVPIQDVYGPTATDASVEAIIVSDETRSGGDAVNKKRSESNLSTLDVWVISLISEDGEKSGDGDKPTDPEEKVKVEMKMGSTAIREWISKKAK